MIRWAYGTVIRVADKGWSEGQTLQIVTVRFEDGSEGPAAHDTSLFPPLQAGDAVLVNTTAVSLGLGTGGIHFIQAPLTGRLNEKARQAVADEPGHIMKLRYTSLQRKILAAEEPASPHHAQLAEVRSLHGLPVLIGELHSMLPAAVCWLRREVAARANVSAAQDLRIAYVMTDGGALPLAVSRHAARLRELGWLCGTVTCGHAYGGDVETVNVYTALLAARHVLQADIAIAAMGPGIVGTGTWYGHTAMETAALIHAVRALDGEPVVMPRISFADSRGRHRGLSSHTLSALGAAFAPAHVSLPLLADGERDSLLRRQTQQTGLGERHQLCWMPAPRPDEIGEAFEPYGERITTMGRDWTEDGVFFQAVGAAVAKACSLLHD